MKKKTSFKESARIQALKNIIRDFNIIITRLRASRDLYRFNIKIVTIKNKELKAKIKIMIVKKIIILKSLNFDAKDTK